MLSQAGLQCEVCKKGSLQVTFNAEDKITRLSFFYDVVSSWRQIQHAATMPDLRLTPNFLTSAVRATTEPYIVTETTTPFRAIQMNQGFTDLTGYSIQETVGAPVLNLLSGPATSVSVIAAFRKDCEAHR